MSSKISIIHLLSSEPIMRPTIAPSPGSFGPPWELARDRAFGPSKTRHGGATLNHVKDPSIFSAPPVGGYVRLSGDVDAATVPHYAGEVISVAQTAERVVTVDVSDITVIDSAGLGLLADVLTLGTARGHTVVLQGASTDLHKLLLHYGIESLFCYH